LTVLVRWQESHLACKNFCFKAEAVNVSILCSAQPVYFKKVVLCYEDVKDKDDWRLRINGATS